MALAAAWLKLRETARQGDAAGVQRLPTAGVEFHAADPRGKVAFHWATEPGRSEVLQLLLDAHAAVTQYSTAQYSTAAPDGSTALHLAAKHGQAAVVQKLVASGAAVDEGQTALKLAAVSRAAAAERLVSHPLSDLTTEDGVEVEIKSHPLLDIEEEEVEHEVDHGVMLRSHPLDDITADWQYCLLVSHPLVDIEEEQELKSHPLFDIQEEEESE